jgi:hypothetical protein
MNQRQPFLWVSYQIALMLRGLLHSPHFCHLCRQIARLSQRRFDKQVKAANANLYAVGNDMSSVMQSYYTSSGITPGPAMTSGCKGIRYGRRCLTLDRPETVKISLGSQE